MNLSSADLCKLSVQEVADLLLEKLVDQEQVGCKVVGECDGRMFEMCISMREVTKDDG